MAPEGNLGSCGLHPEFTLVASGPAFKCISMELVLTHRGLQLQERVRFASVFPAGL